MFRERTKHTTIASTNLDMLAGWFGLPGGIKVATRLRWDAATDTLVDMFPAGTMLLFIDGSVKGGSIASEYEKDQPVFVQQPGMARTTATFAQLYTLNGGLTVGKERIVEANDTVVNTVRFTGNIVLPSIGPNNLSAAGFLASNLV